MSEDENRYAAKKVKIRGVKVKVEPLRDDEKICDKTIWEHRDRFSNSTGKGPFTKSTQQGDTPADHPNRVYYRILSTWFEM